ncbi:MULTISPECIES: DUF695 domain-containing protein [Niastella]|uniref:DUF695 domain-containing protein n=1 Tax=Niastella soli TaxID=2821487 RepID=A0ABS3YWN1_9BACT|nr:DUF695 domain-containing protein [Niastella soli]MBO9202337.1 DUF695 domain-containing protein [Niastella soli]
MSFLKRLFSKKAPIHTYADFWNWFQQHEKMYFNAVKTGGTRIEKDLFDKLSPKLHDLKEGLFLVAGMYDEHTAELIITPDGVIKNIVFAEEIIQAAPAIAGWKFTALKPALDMMDVRIKMEGYVFDKDHLSFYSNDNPAYPDEIDITVLYQDYKKEDETTIINGTYIFLDNTLGELNSVVTIDNLTVAGEHQPGQELIPIEKLKDFLIWRQKEFLEKYDGHRHDTECDSYAGLEAQTTKGWPLVAVVNSTLLEWDAKASHPWILHFDITYDGTQRNGLPDNDSYQLMAVFEEEVMHELKDFEGYLNIARETANNKRTVYFACKDFRKPSKVLHQLIKEYNGRLTITYDVFKDKYWQSLNKFMSN